MTKIERSVRLDRLVGIKDFTNLATKYRCNIKVKGRHSVVDGKSIMGIVSLAINQPLIVVAEGDDALDFAGQLDKLRRQ